MNPSLPTSIKTRPWVVGLIFFVLAFDFAFFWQHAADAYRSEFGRHPDESSHVVTGLFVRDVLAEAVGNLQGSPVAAGKQSADDYFAHYPIIRPGVQTPFFHVVQGVWTFPLGASRTTLLLLMGVLAGSLGLLVFWTLREEYGTSAGSLGAVLVLLFPLVRDHYSMVMPEILCALLMFLAVLAFGDFLERERKQDAVCFGIFAALAILTEQSGFALAVAAPLALLWTRKFHLLRKSSLWFAVVVVALGSALSMWIAPIHPTRAVLMPPELLWNSAREAFFYYASRIDGAVGIGALPLIAVGWVVKTRPRSANRGRWVAFGALILAVVTFRCLAPAGLESRHLVPALPAAVMFAIAGLCVMDTWWRWKKQGKPTVEASDREVASGRSPRPGVIFCLGAILLLIAPWTHSPWAPKGWSGFESVAEAMLAEAAPAEVTLVSSDALGEGMFIAEVALQDRRPGHPVRRVSTLLATGAEKGGEYAPAFRSDEELFAFLTSGEIRYLVVDEAVSGAERREHHDQLARVIAGHGNRFFPVAEAESSRAGQIQSAPIRLYKISHKN